MKQPGLFDLSYSKEMGKSMKIRVEALKRSYDAVKRLGYKGSYNRFVLDIGAGSRKPSFTFPGFGGSIDIHKAIGKLPKPKRG